MRIQVLDIHRAGAYVQIDLALTCLQKNHDDSCGTAAFGTRLESGPGADADDSGDDGGIYLIDPANDRAYYAVRDADGNAYASDGALLSGGTTYLDWVRYPAPPASVTSVDVAVPEGPLFEHVPITNGATPRVPASWTVDPPAQFDTPASDTTTTGLTLPDEPLSLDTGNRSGSNRQAGDSIQLTLSSDVLFAFDKANLSARTKAILANAAAQIKGRARGVVQVTGYTDSIGSDAVNVPLSIHRAEAVERALKPLTPGVSYHSTGLGSADPVAPNTLADGKDNPAGRALNRRVTVTFTATKPEAPTPPPETGTTTAPTAATAGDSFTFATGENLSPTDTPDAHWQATVQSLTRDGNLAVLEMSVSCVEPVTNCGGSYDLSGSTSVPPVSDNSTGDAIPNMVSGFYLEDASGTLYVPVRDAYANPIVSALDGDGGYPHGVTQAVWVYFPVPPAGVSTVKLIAPQGIAALQIPITGG